MCSHSKFHQRKERGPQLPVFPSQRTSQCDPGQAAERHNESGVIQLSTGLLPGISPVLFNSVIRTTIECCFIRAISQTLSSLTASEMAL